MLSKLLNFLFTDKWFNPEKLPPKGMLTHVSFILMLAIYCLITRRLVYLINLNT